MPFVDLVYSVKGAQSAFYQKKKQQKHSGSMFNVLTNKDNIDPEPSGRLLGFKAVQILYQLHPSDSVSVSKKKKKFFQRLLATVYCAVCLR